jgi:AcrR family transcriptional regulator
MAPRRPPAAPGPEPTPDPDGAAPGRSGAATRARLLDAGMRVLATRGYHAARVDDVVAEADVSHGTFYLYFPNKEALVLALAGRCAHELGALTAALGGIPADDSGRTAVRDWLTDFVAIYRSYGVVIRSWVENQVDNPELTQLGLETFSEISEALMERMAVSHPQDAALRLTALVSMIERFTSLVVSRDLGDDAVVLDTAATVIHQAFFAGAAA